jgi:penicillin-binding protein-related factor A (putative recombinase)
MMRSYLCTASIYPIHLEQDHHLKLLCQRPGQYYSFIRMMRSFIDNTSVRLSYICLQQDHHLKLLCQRPGQYYSFIRMMRSFIDNTSVRLSYICLQQDHHLKLLCQRPGLSYSLTYNRTIHSSYKGNFQDNLSVTLIKAT